MQKIFGIKQIDNDLVLTNDKKKLAVLKVESLNFQIKPEKEQEAITLSFQNSLILLIFQFRF